MALARLLFALSNCLSCSFLCLGLFRSFSYCIQLTQEVIRLDESFFFPLLGQLCLLVVGRMVYQMS